MNQSASSQNSKLINGVLKDELGFQGFVVTDWLAHQGGVSSALAGLDMSMPGDGAIPLFGDSYWGPELSRSILNGTVPVDRLNDMVCVRSNHPEHELMLPGHSYCGNLVQDGPRSGLSSS